MIRYVFIGSSFFGLPALASLCETGLAPQLVVSQTDKPAGRNLHSAPTPVSEFAQQHSLKLFTPDNINAPESIMEIADTKPDILITASYGGYIGRQLRSLAPFKAINLHPSLLPHYRGASPIQSALLKGETLSGTTIFRLVAEMDAGPIIAQETLPIQENENYSSLHVRMANQAASMLLKLIKQLPKPLQETPQESSQATWCPKIDSPLCQISWQNPAQIVNNKIRAFSFSPGAWVYHRSSKLKILAAQISNKPANGEPGTLAALIKNIGFTVNCLDYQLLITQVQAAGKKMMSATAFANGARLKSGEKLWM